VGDGAVGKTTFLISFTLSCFPQEYIPTIFDNYSSVYEFEGRKISLGLWDTAGQEDFHAVRPISYNNADVFLLFFSTVLPTSAENIKSKWLKEIKQHSTTTPVFLIGSQIDLREDEKTLAHLATRKEKVLSTKDGKKIAKEIGAVEYLEISAKEDKNYRSVFDQVVRYVINDYKQKKVPGKQCWSIHCREKIYINTREKCSGECDQYYCHDCMEYWEDGFKGCPQCIVYEKEKREGCGKPPKIRKFRVSPQQKVSDQFLAMKRAYEEKLQDMNNPNVTGSGSTSSNTEEKR